MSGGGGTNTVTQSAEPPAFIQPFIQQALQGAQDQFQNFSPQFFPGSTVAGQSPFTQQGVDQLTQFGNSSFNQNVLGNALGAQQSLTGFNPVLGAGLQQLPQNLNFLSGVQQQGAPQVNADAGAQTQVEGVAGQTGQGTADALSGALGRGPGQNPFTSQLISDVQGLNTRNFEQGVLPSLRNAGDIQGGFGGSRQGIAEGLAAQGLADANARAATQISNDQFNQDAARQLQAIGLGGQLSSNASNAELGRIGLGNQLGLGEAGLGLQQQGLGVNAAQLGTGLLGQGFGQGMQGAQSSLALSPALQQMGLSGTQSLLAGGDIDRNFQQALLNDEIARFNFTQQQPAISQSNFQNAAFGLPNLQNTSMSEPFQSGGLAGALGGAATAAGLAGGISSLGGGAAAAMSGPLGWGLIGLGALAGFL